MNENIPAAHFKTPPSPTKDYTFIAPDAYEALFLDMPRLPPFIAEIVLNVSGIHP